MAKPILCGIAALLAGIAGPGHARPRDAHLASLAHRLFPGLSALSLDAGEHTPALVRIMAARKARMAACDHVPRCLFTAAIWTDSERAEIADAVAASGTTIVVADDGPRAQIVREMSGLNHIFEIYGLGQAPRYPEIDGPDPKPGSQPFEAYTAQAVRLGEAAQDDADLSLDPSIALALSLLDAADRDNAIRLDAPEAQLNAAPRAHRIDWAKYRFTAIIVPGVGPDDLVTPLSPTGKLNVRMAATRYFDHAAPLIIVTGGTVHPRGTHFAEAIEMRRALIERFGVPPEAIVVEPYARHTTTNLRNVARLLASLGAPADRDALIVTYGPQSRYIESPVFTNRNQIELGYQPGTLGARLSPTELAWRPASASLRIDPKDPLDP